jgi:hypothetical protein
MDLLNEKFIKDLIQDFKTAYGQYNNLTGEKLEEDFFKELEKRLDSNHYAQHFNTNFEWTDHSAKTIVRFANSLMWHMWSPFSGKLTEEDHYKVREMDEMSNIANTNQVVRFIIHCFNNYLNEWKNILGYTGPQEGSSLCKILLTKRGLPVIPDKDEDFFTILSSISFQGTLTKIKQLNDSIPQYTMTPDQAKLKNKFSDIREQLEHLFEMYLFFLNGIDELKKIFNEILSGNINVNIRGQNKQFKRPNTAFFNTVDRFLGSYTSKFNTYLIFEAAHSEIKNNKLRYNIYSDDLITQNNSDLLLTYDKLNESAHPGDLNLDIPTIEIIKSSINLLINSFEKFYLIPETVVFYRKEEDIFGKHYKGNTIFNKPFVMLSQTKPIKLGKFYFVKSFTENAFLDGYFNEIPDSFLPEILK